MSSSSRSAWRITFRPEADFALEGPPVRRPAAPPRGSRRSAGWALACIVAFAGCASGDHARAPLSEPPPDTRTLITRLIPSYAADRAGWASDIHAAFAALKLPATRENICAVLAVTEQESSFRADPPVPNLAEITWDEIDRRAERMGLPQMMVRTALKLKSSTGQSYGERIDAAKTERELSLIFEDFVGMVPLGRRLLAGWNPVRTGGPMQVGIAFSEQHAASRPYPYPVEGSIRHEVFTRRGGVYFGVAHLLDYPASYERLLYRFADFNAGHYASRNAAFQNALSLVSGTPLELDGDLVRFEDNGAAGPGSTELAARALAQRLDLSHAEIRRALERGQAAGFETTALYQGVFALADQQQRRPLPRALLPRITLKSPKFTRRLTTEWFANRVDERFRRCMTRRVAARG